MEKHTSYLRVSACPHIHTSDSTTRIMLNVIIALMPALVASVLLYGVRSLIVVATTVAACVLFEYLWCRFRHFNNTVGDCSAIVTGLLLAYNLPSTIPLYMAVVGAFVSIIVVKELFGGIGRNFANPAIVGRIVLAVSFSSAMTNFTYPTPLIACDAITSATPLASGGAGIPLLDLFLGTHGGVLGETCALALLLGLVWLLVTHTIEITIPLVYVGTVAVLSAVFGQNVLGEVLSGGLLLGAIFMATDYTTSPFTRKGKIIFALGCGVITCLIRFWGNMNEGVSYSILLMNLFVPFINEHTRNVPMGGGKAKK
ncbi:MAG: RnfABCDGE type electron transport complex subunit D [Oscillospiraceae bacterium]|nr:RnfABCDGE type electron transport complex subunit D [Oscillospiraceae bacterium]